MTRPARYVTAHRSAPGEPFSHERAYSWTMGNCNGAIRTLYHRVDGRWRTAGWLCLRCGTLELAGGIAHLRGFAPQLDPAARIGVLQPVSTPAATVPDVDTARSRDVDDEMSTPARRTGVYTDVDDEARPWPDPRETAVRP